MTRKLSPQEAAFCRAYVLDTNRDGKAAALQAGYSENGAKEQAYRMLKRPHVQAEIKRLEGDAIKRSGVVSNLLTAAHHTADRDQPVSPGSIADQIRNETDADTIAALARAYILAAVKENLDICLGRRKRTLVKFRKVKREGDNGKAVVVQEEYEIKIYDPNPSAANQAAIILLAAPEISGKQPGADQPDEAKAAISAALKGFE